MKFLSKDGRRILNNFLKITQTDSVLDDEWIQIECVAAFFGAGVANAHIKDFFDKAQKRSWKSAVSSCDFSYYLTLRRAPFDNGYIKNGKRKDLEGLAEIVHPHPIKIPSDLYAIARKPKVALLYSELSELFFEEDYSMANMSFIRLVLALNFLPRADVDFSVSQCKKFNKRNVFYLLSILQSKVGENRKSARDVAQKIYKPSTQRAVPKKEKSKAAKVGSKSFAEENI